MTSNLSYSLPTREAARLLGMRIRAARLQRRWSVQELAGRVGVTHATIHKVERGNLSVKLGTALEAAAILGIPLFDSDRSRRRLETERARDQLALLPQLARRPRNIDDAF
jgi:transcriptional regulator with XRE-family HTH domain